MAAQKRPYYDPKVAQAAREDRILREMAEAIAQLPKELIKLGVAVVKRPSDETMKQLKK